MGEVAFRDVIRVTALIIAIVLLFFSLMAVGRHWANLHYQRAARINGIRWIQSWTNLRIHGNRALFASVYIFIGLLGFLKVPDEILIPTASFFFLIVLLSCLVSSIMDWQSENIQLHILLRHDENTNFPLVRRHLHKLRNLLGIYFAGSSIKAGDTIQLEDEISKLLDDIHNSIRKMDTSYVIPTDKKDVESKE
jgi:hypothetical protein